MMTKLIVEIMHFYYDQDGHIKRYYLKYNAKMDNDPSSKAATMIYSDSEVLLAVSVDEKSDWILDSNRAYQLCGDREMFSTYASCDGGFVWMTKNTTSRVVGK